MPPSWMWHLDDELEHHFERVKARRRSGARGGRDDDEGGPMIQNEYARGRGREMAKHG